MLSLWRALSIFSELQAVSKDLDKCLWMLDVKHGHMNFRIPLHCSKILTFTVFENPVVCSCIHLMSVSRTKSWYFSIVILFFCPQEWKKSQMSLFFFSSFVEMQGVLKYLCFTLLWPFHSILPGLFFLLSYCLWGLPLTAKFSVPRF